MADDDAPPQAPTTVRRLETSSATSLGHLGEMFEDLQMVLRCCEKLVTALAQDPRDEVVVESVWTTALLSYARCFSPSTPGDALGEDDLRAAQSGDEVVEWHQVLLRLREHYVDATANPRERFSVGVAQDEEGAASGLAITSARQPLVDEVTVHQTGAIAYALSGLLDARITERQRTVFDEVQATPQEELDKLVRLEVADPPGTS